MGSTWKPVRFDTKLIANMDDALLSTGLATVENAVYNDAGGQSRFPGLKNFVSIPCQRSYLWEYRNDLVVVTDRGTTWRVDKDGRARNVTKAPVSGGQRAIFDSSEDDVLIAAGGPIIRLGRDQTEVLSEQAPDTTHVCYIDGYVIAIERFSGRVRVSKPGDYRTWDPLDVFTAESKPDDATAAVVTPYGELLICGVDSIEQFESIPNGNLPFGRRWSSGEGLGQPYTLCATVQGNYGVNKKVEFVRWNGQTSNSQSENIDLMMQKVDDWTDAWSAEVLVKGQKLVLLQAPNATNSYQTKGITLLLDYVRKKWSQLYGWDATNSLPTRWPGWSHHFLWGRHFVGVPGGVAELDLDTFANQGVVMPMVVRTGHFDGWGTSTVDDFEVRLKRGVWPSGTVPQGKDEPLFGIRVNRDNEGFRNWTWRKMGRYGERNMTIRLGGFGTADTWQFELMFTDPAVFEFVGARALVQPVQA
jgi:hypothetical protein